MRVNVFYTTNYGTAKPNPDRNSVGISFVFSFFCVTRTIVLAGIRLAGFFSSRLRDSSRFSRDSPVGPEIILIAVNVLQTTIAIKYSLGLFFSR